METPPGIVCKDICILDRRLTRRLTSGMFGSDTEAHAHPAILEALSAINSGKAPSYGADETSAAAKRAMAEIFETDVEIYPCISGTAANALALAILCPSTGSILCHREAHIERDERGAPEFFTGGGKLQLLDGPHAKISMDSLSAALAARHPDFVHETPAQVLSLTNLSESGAAYTGAEIAERAELARRHGLSVHLDGARFANAIDATGQSPADLSWRAGVDVLTFGATKNGALGCDVIVLFGAMRDRVGELAARAKRAGHMPAKMRYLSAQLNAYLADDLWLTLAARANAAARHLAERFTTHHGGELVHPVDGNEVFVRLSDNDAATLRDHGVNFYPWPGGCHRFVCSWSTTLDDIETALSPLSAQPSIAS